MDRFWIAATSLVVFVGGCQNAPSQTQTQTAANGETSVTDESAANNQSQADPIEGLEEGDEILEEALVAEAPPATSPDSQAQDSDAQDSEAPVEFITAREAARRVATMPALIDPRERLEVLLHAALYRAAMDSNVAGFTSYFLLEPAPESQVPSMSIPPAEFRLRVLAALDRPIVTVAWNPQPGDRSQRTFPDTKELATRLSIRIHERIADEATVKGEVSDYTTNVGASRQGVTATWDGERWNIERDRVRVVW